MSWLRGGFFSLPKLITAGWYTVIVPTFFFLFATLSAISLALCNSAGGQSHGKVRDIASGRAQVASTSVWLMSARCPNVRSSRLSNVDFWIFVRNVMLSIYCLTVAVLALYGFVLWEGLATSVDPQLVHGPR